MSIQQFDAQSRPVRGDFGVDLGAAADWPSVATLTNGRIVIVSGGHDSPSSIRSIQLDQSLNPIAPSKAANVSQTGLQHGNLEWSVASSPTGEYLISWYNSAGNIIARRFDNLGVPLGPEFIANSPIGGQRRNPNVAYNSKGEFWIAWKGENAGSNDVYLRRFASNGAPLGPEWVVNEFVRGDQGGPQVAVGSDDGVAISWTSADNSGTGVFARIYYADGSPATGEFQVNQFQTGNQKTPWPHLHGTFVSSNKYIFTWVGNGAQGNGVYMTIFAASRIAITTDAPGRSVIQVDGSTYPTPKTFNWVAGTPHTIGVASPQSGGAGTRLIWTGWNDGGAQSHSITTPASDATYTARFREQYLLSTQAMPANGGSVVVSPGSAGEDYFDSGSVLRVNATPSVGFQLANWSGDLTGPMNPQSLTMSGPRSVTANFVRGGGISTCGGTCSLSMPGQVTGAGGGAGGVDVIATSTWDVVQVDGWIQVTSGTAGSGNGRVTFAVSANPGTPRSGVRL